jgi:hypothetical protein
MVKKVVAGRILKILVPEGTDRDATVVVEHFSIADDNDPHFDMPLLHTTNQFHILKPKVAFSYLYISTTLETISGYSYSSLTPSMIAITLRVRWWMCPDPGKNARNRS